MAANEFERLCRAAIEDRYGTAQALAHAIGVSHTALSRGLVNGTLSLEALLRLARELALPPDVVLRKAKKARAAALLHDLYAEPSARLTPLEARVLTALRALPPDAQQAWLRLAETHPGRTTTEARLTS